MPDIDPLHPRDLVSIRRMSEHDHAAGQSQLEPRIESTAAEPSLAPYAEVLRLQRAIGNRAVARLAQGVLARQPTAPSGGAPTSKLVGLFDKLKWKDYNGTPEAGKTYLAGSFMQQNRTIGGASLGTASFEASGGAFKLKDSLVVTVTLASKSWARLDGLSSKEQDLLLEHEQGHHDIAALVARDMFIQIMALKQQTFKSLQEGARALAKITNTYDALYTKIDNLYDSVGETGHKAIEHTYRGPAKPAAQTRWEGFLDTARTKERPSGETAPNGAAYKVELADVLRAAGQNI
jgi:hypothetical protein